MIQVVLREADGPHYFTTSLHCATDHHSGKLRPSADDNLKIMFLLAMKDLTHTNQVQLLYIVVEIASGSPVLVTNGIDVVPRKSSKAFEEAHKEIGASPHGTRRNVVF